MKLIRELDLKFGQGETPRKWTVIIGENGTGKTSILQAIAMAAAGGRHVTTLVANGESLKDKRSSPKKSTMSIEADFVLDERLANLRQYPGLDSPPQGNIELCSKVSVAGKDVVVKSRYLNRNWDGDPLIEARQAEQSLWFVAGYGVHRFLPTDSSPTPSLDRKTYCRCLITLSCAEIRTSHSRTAISLSKCLAQKS